MRIAMVLTPLTDSHLRLASQIGVTDIVGRYPGSVGESMEQMKQRVESFRLKLSVIEGYIPFDQIVHGREGRDAQIDNFVELLRDMAANDVAICCYNFMPDGDWSRTSTTTLQRGGALVTGFDVALVDDVTGRGGPITESQLWENLEYFLKRVVPVAEAEGVKLAMHPDDPPMSPLRGQERIFGSVASFDRLVELLPSAVNGLCFCQGTFAEMGVDIPTTIRHFKDHIHYVHFRDVQGTVPKFEETFHDNGKTNMFAAMRAYHEIGFVGPMRPDHVPILDGEEPPIAGYSMLGRLFAAGYMRGLMDAIR